jgi:hypothetical protein
MLCSLRYLKKKYSYNFINAADKGHHAVGTAHPCLGKKYCLVAFDREAPRFIVLPSQAPMTEKINISWLGV